MSPFTSEHAPTVTSTVLLDRLQDQIASEEAQQVKLLESFNSLKSKQVTLSQHKLQLESQGDELLLSMQSLLEWATC